MHDSAAAAADGLSHLPEYEENVASFCRVLKLQISGGSDDAVAVAASVLCCGDWLLVAPMLMLELPRCCWCCRAAAGVAVLLLELPRCCWCCAAGVAALLVVLLVVLARLLWACGLLCWRWRTSLTRNLTRNLTHSQSNSLAISLVTHS
jgi:hypothetical protein